MGANEKLGLPRGKMRKIKIAFDVDGTLRCNCTDTCEDPNERIVALYNILCTFKNTDMYVWSGGGANYAYRFAQKFGLDKAKCRGKLDTDLPQIDIAFDDIQDTAIAPINLIVNEKKTAHTIKEQSLTDSTKREYKK